MNNKTYMIVGLWGLHADKAENGLTVCHYEQGNVTPIANYLPQISVGKMQVYPEERILYCVDEKKVQPEFNNKTGGGKVYAVKINEDASLSEINHRYAYAPLTCYVYHDEGNHRLLVSNHSCDDSIIQALRNEKGEIEFKITYNDVSVLWYPLEADGSIGLPLDVYKQEGNNYTSEYPDSHLHSVVKSPFYDLYIVCDKGKDNLYALTIENGRFQEKDRIHRPHKSMPRYGCFLPDAPIYVCNYEGSDTLTSFSYDQEGHLKELYTIDVVHKKPGEMDGKSSDVILNAKHHLLYNITRGLNQIDVVEINPTNGQMELLQNIPFAGLRAYGKGPRTLTIDPDGKYVFASAEGDHALLRFTIKEDGLLEEEYVSIPFEGNPGDIAFISLP